MSVKELLIEARERISDPARWTQGELARDSDGDETLTFSDDAVCWCAYGSIYASRRFGYDGESAMLDLETACKDVFGLNQNGWAFNIADINDGHVPIPGLSPHEAVLKIYDRAIENCDG